jgi:hypothetical protein
LTITSRSSAWLTIAEESSTHTHLHLHLHFRLRLRLHVTKPAQTRGFRATIRCERLRGPANSAAMQVLHLAVR